MQKLFRAASAAFLLLAGSASAQVAATHSTTNPIQSFDVTNAIGYPIAHAGTNYDIQSILGLTTPLDCYEGGTGFSSASTGTLFGNFTGVSGGCAFYTLNGTGGISITASGSTLTFSGSGTALTIGAGTIAANATGSTATPTGSAPLLPLALTSSGLGYQTDVKQVTSFPYTVLASDSGYELHFCASNAASVTLPTIASASLPTGWSVTLINDQYQSGTACVGTLTVSSASTISGASSSATPTLTPGQFLTAPIDPSGTYYDIGRCSSAACMSNQSATTAVSYVTRGFGNHMLVPNALDTSTAGSRCYRWQFQMPAPFSSLQLVLPTFYVANPSGTTYTDTLVPTGWTMQAAFEYPYLNASSGLNSNRPSFKVSGSSTMTYTAGSGPGYILTDSLSLGYYVPANTPFGIEICLTSAAGLTVSSGTIPTSGSMNSYLGNMYESELASTSTDYVASNYASTNKSWPTNSIGGGSYGPAEILISVPSTTVDPAFIGDSICTGVGDGYPPSSTLIAGNLNGDAGWMEKYVHTQLGFGYINFCKYSDSFASEATASNIQYRAALATFANPTHWFVEMGHNDASESYSTFTANALATFQNWNSAVPGLKFVCATVLPSSHNAGSASLWGLTSDQTADSGWGTGGVITQWNNTNVRGLTPLATGIGCNRYVDASDTVSTTRESGIWIANQESTLAAAITSTTQTTMTINNYPTNWPLSTEVPFPLYFPSDGELVNVTGGAGTTTLTITRGYNGTTAGTPGLGSLAYLSGAYVYGGPAQPGGIHPSTLGVGQIYTALSYKSPAANPFTIP